MRYRTDIRYGIEDFVCNIIIFFSSCPNFEMVLLMGVLKVRFHLAAVGGLLGLGLGMSFISVIEVIYYLFYRRMFLWLRSNWPKYRRTSIKATKPNVPPYSMESAKFKKSPSSSPTAIAPTPSVWYLSLDGHSQVVRRGSYNIPAHIKARFTHIN